MKINAYISAVGGVVATTVLLVYAYNVVLGKAKAESIATWFMWTVLDVLLVATAINAGKPFWLPLGWSIGAFLVTASLMKNGKWSWSWKETLSLVCTIVATIIWQTQTAELGVIAGTLAMTFAGTPILIDMVRKPIRATFPVWFWTCVACACTLIGSDWTLAGTFLPWGSLLYNGTLSVLALRDDSDIVFE